MMVLIQTLLKTNFNSATFNNCNPNNWNFDYAIKIMIISMIKITILDNVLIMLILTILIMKMVNLKMMI